MQVLLEKSSIITQLRIIVTENPTVSVTEIGTIITYDEVVTHIAFGRPLPYGLRSVNNACCRTALISVPFSAAQGSAPPRLRWTPTTLVAIATTDGGEFPSDVVNEAVLSMLNVCTTDWWACSPVFEQATAWY
ncbi:hypothetical protein [Mycobacterium lepromatosis]|uniref:hypothetical protein n=1 Tax=Mycobacterium lepromatosis TaxID=480418 RepID=UPI0006793B99|nr:hypothetical protein [Mycobacterium lepromatosis]